MNYTPEQLTSIEKTKNVFADFLQAAPDMDLIYSSKVGYVMLYGFRPGGDPRGMVAIYMEDGRQLCDFILLEIAFNTMNQNGITNSIYETTEEERRIIKKVLNECLVDLPEYQDLVDKQFETPY